MTRPPIELVALDIAGTTVEEGGAVYRALADAVRGVGGDPTPADIGRWMGAGKREAIRALLGGESGAAIPAATVDVAFADFRIRLAAAYEAQPPQPIAGVPETLQALRELGIRVALTTGFDREVTTGILDTIGWGPEILDAVICVDDVRAGRPAPYLIFHAMEATGVSSAAAVLAAGDTPLDVRAGRNAGAGMVVGVLSGGADQETLAAERPDHILGTINEVPALL